MPKFIQKLIETIPDSGHYSIELTYAEGSKAPLDPPVWSLWTDDADPSILGWIPLFLDYMDERKASEQFNESFAHGGGWMPISGFVRSGVSIQFPGDPRLEPLASTSLRHEDIFFYNYGWVMILDTNDGTFEVARLS